MKSQCCKAVLIKTTIIDSYHGADDEYELKIPIMKCSKCGKHDLLIFSGEKIFQNQKINYAS